MNEDDKLQKLDPFVRAVRAIVRDDEAKFFLEWLIRNQQEAVRDVALSKNRDDILKISGRLYEYDFIVNSINDALSTAQIGEIELYVSDGIFARSRFGRKQSLFQKFLNLFRSRGCPSSEPQQKI